MTIGVVLPVRNPGPEFLESVKSLAAQSQRDFEVTVSDNHSTKGLEHLGSAIGLLQSAGIPVRVIRPAASLGRVEHWNFACLAVTAPWIKPLFAGDQLEPEFFEAMTNSLRLHPEAGLFKCALCIRHDGDEHTAAQPPCAQDFLSPEAFLEYYPQLGNWIGSPVNVAYRRDAFQEVGGFDTALPAVADYKTAALCALSGGVALEQRPLGVFVLHGNRFSFGIGRRKVNGFLELCIILHQVRNCARDRKLPWREGSLGEALRKQARIDYLAPAKAAVKNLLGQK